MNTDDEMGTSQGPSEAPVKTSEALDGAKSSADKNEHAAQQQENLYFPFASREEWEFASWLLRSGLGLSAIDHLLSLDLLKRIPLSFRTGKQLQTRAEMSPSRPAYVFETVQPKGQTKNTVHDSDTREVGLKRFAEIKIVVMVDDSISMQEGNLWEQAREALAGIVDIANQYGSKGADIHFVHLDDFAENILSRSEVQALFNRVVPEGQDTPTGAKLGQIIDHYLPLIEGERSTHEPITILLITDGLPTDQADLERVIVEAAHRLERHHVKHDMFGIQFVQIGTDPAASELLHVLDDHLVTRYKIRDIIDSTPFDPAQGPFDTEYLLKILLGGIYHLTSLS